MIQNDRKSITLNDGTFIYSAQQLRDYLTSLGFDPENNFEEIRYTLEPLCEEQVRGELEDAAYWERVADGYHNNFMGKKLAIEEKLEKFNASYKITKAQFSEWLIDLLNEDIVDY